MMKERGKAKPFDAFRLPYKVLTWIGFYKILDEPRNRLLVWLHRFYVCLVFLVLVIYNILSFMCTAQERNDTSKLFKNLLADGPTLNVIVKFLSFNLGSARLEKLRDQMDGPMFAPKNSKDEEYLSENNRRMRRLCLTIYVAVTLTVLCWILGPFIARMQGDKPTFNIYLPFEIDSWLGFSLALLIQCGPFPWISFGHLSLDYLIAAYYSQATTQLKMLNYNLQHIFDVDEDLFSLEQNTDGNFQYHDVVDINANKRFVYYVKRYQEILWFIEEVNSIFNIALSVQFLSISAEICLVIYQLSHTPVTNADFGYYIGYYCMVETQLFLFCYFGDLVQQQSDLLASSLYLGDWVSLSPRFRHQLLIAMSRWSQPIIPRLMKLVPLSLETFITMIRAAYSLFTFLKTTSTDPTQ